MPLLDGAQKTAQSHAALDAPLAIEVPVLREERAVVFALMVPLTPPKRFVIIAFDSMEKAQAWNSSPAQKAVFEITAKTTKQRRFIVEGPPQ
jgi:Domain of unknown function (DUF1330)